MQLHLFFLLLIAGIIYIREILESCERVLPFDITNPVIIVHKIQGKKKKKNELRERLIPSSSYIYTLKKYIYTYIYMMHILKISTRNIAYLYMQRQDQKEKKRKKRLMRMRRLRSGFYRRRRRRSIPPPTLTRFRPFPSHSRINL